MVVSNSPAIKCRVLVFFKWYVNHRVLLHFLTRRSSDLWHPLRAMVDARAPVRLAVDRATVRRGDSVTVTLEVPAATRAILWTRSEEHTSELQSLAYLVCRLLLAKE